MMKKVEVWEEDVFIPTYGIGQPEKNPIFLEKRVYQGSSGVVYPYQVIEKIEDECKDKKYHAVFLENEYLKIMILPELGGRVQMAYDKIKQRHFVYYNHVIKPALVGLTGPWISGGIEFNWPQHHRPSTFMPIDYSVEQCEDGSAIVWVSERERMFHQKGMAGFTLRPGRAVLEIQGRLYNPTPVPQTFLWWANPAVAVNDAYQSVFPGDVNAVFDHGRRDVSRYPIATGTYYKMDYSAGVDISRYKNIPVPTSYMAVRSKYDFVGGYENDTQAGLLHVADHHVSPGKKQWTWGNGDFGQAWDRNLTDHDGPYIELMTGVYTDNQPDFSWLQPYEEKSFTQYFMPYRELGVVKNATADLLMNIEPDGDALCLKLFATSHQADLKIRVSKSGQTVLDIVRSVSPEEVLCEPVAASGLEDVEVLICRADGRKILSWKPEPDVVKEIPEPAKEAEEPSKVATTEQLYLTGLHLEQYRHATYQATDYYQEALRRDPGDVRNNNAMGLWMIRKGQFEKAESYLQTAVNTLTERNPNPYDGEPYYNLGLAQKLQGKLEEAYDSISKACWNAAWVDAGYLTLAQISVAQGEWERALKEVNNSLDRNARNARAWHLKAMTLRHLGRHEEALQVIEKALQRDAFNFGCRFEKYLILGDESLWQELTTMMRTDAHNYEELATDYFISCSWTDALTVCEKAIALQVSHRTMLHYYRMWCLYMLNRKDEAAEALAIAEVQPAAGCMPNSLAALRALKVATRLGRAPKAWYYVGNLWYDKRQYTEAIQAWQTSLELDGEFPTVRRNLALASFNKLHQPDKAVELLESAFRLDKSDARVMMELDQLYKCLHRPHAERLEFLDSRFPLVESRDDLYLEYITLLNQLGRYAEGKKMLDARKFHPWEGGEGKVTEQYRLGRLELAKKCMRRGDLNQALQLIEECYVYPDHLGEGKLRVQQDNDLDYWRGCVLAKMDRQEEATRSFKKAANGCYQLAQAMYYNDQKSDTVFYQGLALRKLGREDEARSRFNTLVSYGEKHLFDKFKMDYFAVSLPDLQIWESDMDNKIQVHCHYLMALGHWGLGNREKALQYFEMAARLDNNHQGVQIHRQMCEKGRM